MSYRTGEPTLVEDVSSRRQDGRVNERGRIVVKVERIPFGVFVLMFMKCGLGEERLQRRIMIRGMPHRGGDSVVLSKLNP